MYPARTRGCVPSTGLVRCAKLQVGGWIKLRTSATRIGGRTEPDVQAKRLEVRDSSTTVDLMGSITSAICGQIVSAMWRSLGDRLQNAFVCCYVVNAARPKVKAQATSFHPIQRVSTPVGFRP